MARDRAAFALPLAFMTCLLVALVTMAVHQQVTADRQAFERLHGHRLLVLAARSAFEEAAARIEGANRGVQLLDGLPGGAPLPDPGPGALISPDIAVPLTAEAYADSGLGIGPVHVETGTWARWGARLDRGDAVGRMLARDLGLLHFSVEVTHQVGWSSTRVRVDCQRYVVAAADGEIGALHVHVQPVDMVLQVSH